MTMSRYDKSGLAADHRIGDEPENMPDQPSEGSLKEADKVSGPYIGDAEPNDSPVRTNRPDVPIIQTLKVGAGAHIVPDDPDFDEMGRYDPDGRKDRESEKPEAERKSVPPLSKGSS